MPREPRAHLLLLPLAALLAILPLLTNGPSCGHDLNFHLLSWLEAAHQFSLGNLHPHWAATPAWNAGEPRFVFYPPLSWTLGALLTLLSAHLPWLAESTAFPLLPALYTWIALTACGLSFHALARRYATSSASLVAAAFYLANPYTLFTAYERTAFAELLAAAWLPLLFLAILPPPDEHDPAKISIPRLALPLALLWLTNAPAAVMGSYAMALLLLVRLVSIWSDTHSLRACLQLAARATAGTLFGLALAAFYIVPAAYEQRWVLINMATIPGMRIGDNFLFQHAPAGLPDAADHTAVLHTASLIAVLLLGTAAVLIAWLLLRRRSSRATVELTRPLTILIATAALFLTPLSLPAWRHLPELLFLQFPWRLLALAAPATALLFAMALSSLYLARRPAALLSLSLTAILVWPAYTLFRQGCEPGATPLAHLQVFRSGEGVEGTDEYTPTTADNDALQQTNAPFRLAPLDDSSASRSPVSQPGRPAPLHLVLDAPSPELLILNLRDFPAWHVTVNGTLVTAHHDRDDGLLAFPIPAGHDQVSIRYALTDDALTGDLVSAAALLALLFAFAHSRWLRANRTR